jgi:NADH-quinone oxidoreductase subunit E
MTNVIVAARWQCYAPRLCLVTPFTYRSNGERQRKVHEKMDETIDQDGKLDGFDLAPLEEVLEQYAGQKGAVIPILQHAQEIYGYLPREILAEISRRTGIPPSRLIGVATFYAQFRLTRRGRHLIRVCDGTACHVRGAAKVIETVEKDLAVPAGGTSTDYEYTMEIVYCLGSCGLAPVAVVDDKVYGRLTPNSMVEQLRNLD